MSDPVNIFAVNDELDISALAETFAAKRRVQICDVLTHETATALRDAMAADTPWGLTMQAGTAAPVDFRVDQLRESSGQAAAEQANRQVHAAAQARQSAFRFARYPMVTAYKEQWDPGGLFDVLLGEINSDPFLDLVRAVTDIPELQRADGQATLFGRQHFLGIHEDIERDEGWRIAYVLNMTVGEWHPDWGGYLVFYDASGNIVEGFAPRFNTLNLFAVPQQHAVTFVPSFAPQGRIAVSGWFRDR